MTQAGRSDVTVIYDLACELLSESMLVSAYDVEHGYISQPEEAITAVTFLDSGGYEVSGSPDAIDVEDSPVLPWTEEMYGRVLERWPAHLPSVLVTFDAPKRRVPISQQIEDGLRLKNSWPGQLVVLLLKPETPKATLVSVSTVVALAETLRPFDMIGFTEKELGRSVLDRMESIAKLRRAFDEANVHAPIHVFGGLDPVSTPLYFLAGAEVFDGLTWLRYGFSMGRALYRPNYGALDVGIDRSDDEVKTRMIIENLSSLVDLRNELRRFLVTHDFVEFGPNEHVLKSGLSLLKSKFSGAA